MRIQCIQDFIDKLKIPFYRVKFRHDTKNKIIVIGDSHVNFFSGNEELSFKPIKHIGLNKNELVGNCQDKNKRFYTIHLGPVLAYNSNKIGSSIKGLERVIYLINNNLLPKKSLILCSFGEIDIRVHILKKAEQRKVEVDEIIKEVVSSYFKFLLYLKNNGFRVMVWSPVPNGHCKKNELNLPYYGSEKERNNVTLKFISYLEEFGKKNNIPVLSICKELLNDDFTTKSEYYADLCHLSQRANEFMKKEFFEKVGIKI